METLIKKMTEIVKNHYKPRHAHDYVCNVWLNSFQFMDGDIHATFRVDTAKEMYLYEIIYFLEYDGFRVFCFKLDDQFDMND